MKKAILTLLAIGLISLAGLAGDVMTLKGDIIDNLCAEGHKNALADFVKSHTEACALMPACVASRYSLFAEGQLYKFDAESNGKIEEFLKREDSKLQVSVEFKKVGEAYSLVSIENQT
jgi:hypothetical protein